MIYKDYRQKVRELLEGKEEVIFSDDLDGYVSAAIVQKYLDLDVMGFFNPHELLLTKKIELDKTIGVDVTFDNKNMKVNTISNHVEKVSISDKLSNGVSCNEHIGFNNYTDKSLFSTSLMLWGALNLPLPTTKKGKMLLLLLDSTYMQFYNNSFKKHSIGYLKAYGLDELIDVLESSTKEDFENLQKEFRSKRLINSNNGVIDTDLLYKDGKVSELLDLLNLNKLIIPDKFKYRVVLERKSGASYRYKRIRQDEKVFSFAMIYKNTVNYSVMKEIELLDDSILG